MKDVLKIVIFALALVGTVTGKKVLLKRRTTEVGIKTTIYLIKANPEM